MSQELDKIRLQPGDIVLPDKLEEVFLGEADYRGAWGGRGSGKTRSFAKMSAVRAYMWAKAGESGIILCAREFMNSLDESSMAEVKAAIQEEAWLAPHFDIGEKYIRTAKHLPGSIDFAFAGLRHNLASIKSKARIRLLWVDEAEPVSETAWQTAIPSVREDDAEVWVTWNPLRRGSATDKRFKLDPPSRSKIIQLSYKDNDRFPAILERQRLEDLEKRPDTYAHIWEGDYVGLVEGSYYAKQLIAARAKGQIGQVAADPLMTYRAVWDIGGTGANADAVAVWVCQFVGPQIRVLNYYEAVGQPLATHIAWLRDNGYSKALCVLPHDARQHDKVYDVSYEGALKQAGFETTILPSPPGIVMQRVDLARRLFPNIWFNEDTTSGGIEALGAFHEHKDQVRGIGLGPAKGWFRHGSDAFGLMCQAHESPNESGWGAALGRQRINVV